MFFSPVFLIAANDSTKVILKDVDLLNPEATPVKDSYSLISNAIENDNSENAKKLLDSTEIKENLTDEDSFIISDLKKQAQINKANKLKRDSLRKLLNLAIQKNTSATIISNLTALMVINKNKTPQDKAEIYSDAITLFTAATNVLENAKNKYQALCVIYDLDLASEYKKNLRTSHNNAIVNYLEILKILITTLVENHYEQICHNYQDYNQTIWILYKKARDLCTTSYEYEADYNATPESFKLFLQDYVENVYKWNKRFLMYADATQKAALGMIGLFAVTGIFTSLYFASTNRY